VHWESAETVEILSATASPRRVFCIHVISSVNTLKGINGVLRFVAEWLVVWGGDGLGTWARGGAASKADDRGVSSELREVEHE